VNIKRLGTPLMLLMIVLAASGQEPYFRLRDIDNQWKEYSDLKGDKLTVIDFWATWCQPCVKSIPLLNNMAVEYADEGVRFIGVSIDGTRNQSKIKPFMQSLGISYPIIRDVNSELMSELSVTAVPTLLIYDAEGNQIYFHEGFRPGDEITIEKHISQYLESKND
jgi:thiol-disulfide isomerase/thioredoxin